MRYILKSQSFKNINQQWTFQKTLSGLRYVHTITKCWFKWIQTGSIHTGSERCSAVKTVICQVKVIYVLAQSSWMLSTSHTLAEIVKSAYICLQACMKQVMLRTDSWNMHHETLLKQSGRVHEKIDTGGVPTMLHLVLNSENVPDCKNIFLRETMKVQSTI